MSRLTSIDPATATGKTKVLLDEVQSAFGAIPNMVRCMATSPELLEGWLRLQTALSRSLPAQLQEQVALAVAEQNACEYCLSAHAFLGRHAGVDSFEIERSRSATSADPTKAAALAFAAAVNEKRGGVSDDDLARVRAAGYGDRDIAAIVGLVGLNVLTNCFNRVAATDVEFPLVTPRAEAA